MRILYVRHGRSTANSTASVSTPDTPLAEAGLEQARLTGQDLKGHNVKRIITSSYLRAQQTAEIIAGELGIALSDISIMTELRERGLGELEGKPERHTQEFFYNNDTDLGFESHASLVKRLTEALNQINDIAKQTDGTVVVVGHAISGYFFLQLAKGKKNFNEFETLNELGNAEFIEVELA